jgi:hypothetical protein
MSVTLKTKTVFHCRCVHCGWEWDADAKPHRCAKCKIRSWNGEDHRFAEPYASVPFLSQIETGTEAPRAPSYELMLEVFTEARTIIDDMIVGFGPCDHKKNECVCREKAFLLVLDQQIARLKALQPRRTTYLVKTKETGPEEQNA